MPEALSFKKNPKGRPRLGTEPRVFLGASVDAKTKKKLMDWAERGKRKRPAFNPGQCLDDLVTFAAVQGFIPCAKI